MTKWWDTESEARWMGGITKWAIFFFVLLLLLGTLGLVFGWFSAPFRGAVEQRQKTVGDGDYRIAQYDHFYSLCGDIQALEDQIDNTKQAKPPHWQVNVLALKNQRASLIRDYNADSSKAGTAGQFKASDLPYSIDTTEGHTTCAR